MEGGLAGSGLLHPYSPDSLTNLAFGLHRSSSLHRGRRRLLGCRNVRFPTHGFRCVSAADDHFVFSLRDIVLPFKHITLLLAPLIILVSWWSSHRSFARGRLRVRPVNLAPIPHQSYRRRFVRLRSAQFHTTLLTVHARQSTIVTWNHHRAVCMASCPRVGPRCELAVGGTEENILVPGDQSCIEGERERT